jgi:hypothetical protein
MKTQSLHKVLICWTGFSCLVVLAASLLRLAWKVQDMLHANRAKVQGGQHRTYWKVACPQA